MNEEQRMLVRSVTIKQEHKKYLDEHPDINFSGLVRKCLDEHMSKQQISTINGT
jgi:hypothetical protein